MTDKQHSGTLLQDDQLLPEFRRLVILVPNADMDDIRLARAIRSMMSPSKKGISAAYPGNPGGAGFPGTPQVDKPGGSAARPILYGNQQNHIWKPPVKGNQKKLAPW